MNNSQTLRLVKANGVKTLKADKTREAPEVDRLLVELGNEGKAIPFYAIYPAGGEKPITLDGLITQSQILEVLRQAGPSKPAEPAAAAIYRAAFPGLAEK